jgi:starch synthase
LFSDSKIVVSLYNDQFEDTMDHRLAEKLILDGIDAQDTALLKDPTYVNLMKHAITFADGVVIADHLSDQTLVDFAEKSGKFVAKDFMTGEHADICSNFYEEVLTGEQVAEMAD